MSGNRNRDALRKSLKTPIDLQTKGMDCYNNGNYAEAVIYYTNSLEGVLPTNTTVRYPTLHMRGLCNYGLGNYALAIQDLKEARGLLCSTASKTDKYDTDIAIIGAQIQLIQQDPKSPDVDALCTEIIEKSSGLLLIEPNSDKQELHESRMSACMRYINNHEDNYSYNRLVIQDTSYLIDKMDGKIDTNNGKGKALLFTYLRSRGTAYLRSENFEKALENYDRIDERFRSRIDWEFMTRAYVGVENYDKALECAAKIPPKKPGVSFVPNTTTLLFLRAKSTAEIEKEQYPDAIKTLQTIISHRPDYAYMYHKLAHCYRELQKSDTSSALEYNEKIYSCIKKSALIDPELFKSLLGEECFSSLFAPKEVKNSLSYAGEKNSLDEGEKETVATISDDMSLVTEIATLKVKPEQQVVDTIAATISDNSSDDIYTDADYSTYLSYIDKKSAQSYIHKLSIPESNTQTPRQIIEWNLPSDHNPVPAMDGINKGFGKAWSDRLSSNSTLYTYFDKTSKTIADLRASKKSDPDGLYKKFKDIIVKDGHMVGPVAESGIKALSGPMKGKFEAKICGEIGKNKRIYGEAVSSLDGKHTVIVFREYGDAMHR